MKILPTLALLAACAAHVPRPYTAEAIHDAFVPGLEVVWEHRMGDAVTEETWRVTEADDDRVHMRFVAGESAADVREIDARWVELRDHATFPKRATVVGEETLDTPLGTLACTRYVVTRDGGTATYWFAKDLAGPPVRFELPDGSVHRQVAREVRP